MPRREFFGQPILTRPAHKLLHKKLRIPQRFAQPVLSAVRIAADLDQYRLRRRLAREVLLAGRPPAAPSAASGFRLFAAGELPGAREAANLCAEIFEKKRPAIESEGLARAGRPFLVPVLDGSELLEHPDLIRFMVSRTVLDAAVAYLGCVPRAAGATLSWSPVNRTARSSQLYHLDDDDLTQLKLFVAVTETREDQGPLTFLPAPASRRAGYSWGAPVGRVPDEHIRKRGLEDAQLRLVGPAGTAAFVDTSRCLHYGSRENRRERLILQIQFLRFHAPGELPASFQVPSDLPGLSLDPVQRLALGLA